MSKMFSEPASDLVRYALSGPTMGSSWSALFYGEPDLDHAPIRAALQGAVDEVDAQMSIWKPDSDLMRLNAAPVGAWLPVQAHLMAVLDLGLRIGRESDGTFDIGMGDAVRAWGFGPNDADPGRICAALVAPRCPAHELLELDPAGLRLRKHAAVTLDLNGIAKGYGVDRLIEMLHSHGISAALAGIDGEMRATGLRPDGTPWVVAVESPDPARRAVHSVLTLQDAAVATSGDYRHWVELQGRRLSHTMDPVRGGPLVMPPASVTVLARTCAEADAWTTALMVLGKDDGMALAQQRGFEALFMIREESGTRSASTGAVLGKMSAEPSHVGA